MNVARFTLGANHWYVVPQMRAGLRNTGAPHDWHESWGILTKDYTVTFTGPNAAENLRLFRLCWERWTGGEHTS